jgi:hypothetical protein
MKMDNQKNTEKTPHFLCEICDFKCCRKTEYKRHLETIKHKRVIESNKKTPNPESNTFVCICGKTYKYRPGLAKHKRTCMEVNTSMETTTPVLEIKETEIYKKMHEHIDNKTD